MAYVLYNQNEVGTPHVLKRYETRKGALIGMRASNKNAGWQRRTLTSNGIYLQEWCVKKDGAGTTYEYAPYVIAHEVHFDAKYGRNELVPVVSLMSGATVMIPQKDRGGCTDPSTERYWSM